ncbi:hypothetical protein FB451DRAFT_1490121 [Mycena latifolia]|nr:hypothetical protein FB451DRAFT_1490121 [Mycena latifolia]
MTPHHIAAMLMKFWGHTGSYIYLASRMLQKDPTLVVTIVQHNLLGYLNEYYGFAAIAQEVYLDEARRHGRTLAQVLDQAAKAWDGSDHLFGLVMKCPGVPDMYYDHERIAYGADAAVQARSQRFVDAQKLARPAEGYIVNTSICLEPVGVPYCKAF